VIALREPVSLTRVDDEFVLDPELAERAVEVHGLADRHVGVVLAVQDQDRGADLRGVGDRAELVVAVRVAFLCWLWLLAGVWQKRPDPRQAGFADWH